MFMEEFHFYGVMHGLEKMRRENSGENGGRLTKLGSLLRNFSHIRNRCDYEFSYTFCSVQQ